MWHIVLSAVLALLFLATGAGKVLGLSFANRNRDGLAVHPTFWRVTGLLEWAGAAGLVVGIWIPVLGVLAASGLALLMVGAIVSRVRAARLAGNPAAKTRGLALAILADAVVLAVAAITAVLIARGL